MQDGRRNKGTIERGKERKKQKKKMAKFICIHSITGTPLANPVAFHFM